MSVPNQDCRRFPMKAMRLLPRRSSPPVTSSYIIFRRYLLPSVRAAIIFTGSFLSGFAASGVRFVVKPALRQIACARRADVAAAGSNFPAINKQSFINNPMLRRRRRFKPTHNKSENDNKTFYRYWFSSRNGLVCPGSSVKRLRRRKRFKCFRPDECFDVGHRASNIDRRRPGNLYPTRCANRLAGATGLL